MKTHKIYGPPGTGKTTYLLGVVENLLEEGVAPNNIGFTTFTKAGATEALERACAKFDRATEEFPYFKTIHALTYASGSKKRVLGYADYMQLSENLGMPITYTSNNGDGIVANYRGDNIMHLYNLSRVKMVAIEEVFCDEETQDITVEEVIQFGEYYEKFKTHIGKQDFTDMLESFIDRGRPLPIQFAIIDEAQDTKPLEWKALEVATGNCLSLWIGGDDDQAIHSWAGSVADVLLEKETDNSTVLSQSYRVPKAVHDLSQSVIKKVATRKEKAYRPTDEAGSVSWIHNLDQLPELDGSWFLLSRNRKFLGDFERYCEDKCILYDSPTSFNNGLTELCAAARDWEHLLNGGMITGKQVKHVYKYLKARDRVKHGFKQVVKNTLDDDQMVDIHQLQSRYGLLWSQSWETAFITLTREDRESLALIEKKYGFDKTPTVTINTIHGVKGKEADNVVIMLDMARRSYNGYQEDPDNEHRVFYVGMTRARKNLYLMHPESDMYYSI